MHFFLLYDLGISRSAIFVIFWACTLYIFTLITIRLWAAIYSICWLFLILNIMANLLNLVELILKLGEIWFSGSLQLWNVFLALVILLFIGDLGLLVGILDDVLLLMDLEWPVGAMCIAAAACRHLIHLMICIHLFLFIYNIENIYFWSIIWFNWLNSIINIWSF